MAVKTIGRRFSNIFDFTVSTAAELETDAELLAAVAGSTCYAEDTGEPYFKGASGWVKSYVLVKLIAGDLNLGNVDVVTLPGTVQVDISAMKAKVDTLQADIATIKTTGTPVSAALPAGEAHVGEIGGNTLSIIVTPVIGAAAFTAGDFVGGKLTLANAGRVAGGSGIINSLQIVDGAKQGITKGALRIYLFNADLAGTYADNAVESFTLADLQKLCPGGVIDVPISYWGATLANASVTVSEMLRNLNIPYKCAAGTSIYAIIRTLSDPTYTANCLQLTFGLLRD